MVRYPDKGNNWKLGGFERNPIDYRNLLDEIELDNMYAEYHKQELTPICRTPKVILP